MRIENTNMNIPSVSVGKAVNELSALYTSAYKGNIPFKNLPTVFLWGAAGVGKSDGVRQIAANIETECGRKVIVVDIRLLLFSPVDLRGVPMADEHREFTNWLKPKIFDLSDSNAIYILFLDELSAAPQSVQAAAYQICLDRKIGEHTLPENCIVIAAGNRMTDQSVSYKMPKALCNRLMHFNIESDFLSWKSWAIQNGIDRRIIGYLSFDNSKLCTEPESSDLAYATPRSWNFVSNLLATTGKEPAEIHNLVSSCVGAITAVEFETWCGVFRDLPKVDDIIKGIGRDYPRRQDVLYALISSLTSAVFSRRMTITQEQLEHVCVYAVNFPPDFALAFFKDLNKISEIKLKLMKCRSIQNLFTSDKKYLWGE